MPIKGGTLLGRLAPKSVVAVLTVVTQRESRVSSESGSCDGTLLKEGFVYRNG